MPNDPKVAELSPYQVEFYRHVMYEQKKEEREFILSVIKSVVESGSVHIADLIAAKIGALIGGSDFYSIGRPKDETLPLDEKFTSQLARDGLKLSEEDISYLSKEGIDLSSLVSILPEV